MKASDVKSVARKQTQSDKKYQHRVREQLRTKNQILDEI
jgi:hypothetical protein